MTGGTRLSRWLFALAVGLAGALLALVLLAPRLERGAADSRECSRVIVLFARDRAVRRTSLAGALGLLVSACVFFRGRPDGGGSCSTGCSRAG
jgi:hypothetical protein